MLSIDRCIALALCLPVLCACTGPAEQTETFTVRDSAGVRIVENRAPTISWGCTATRTRSSS